MSSITKILDSRAHDVIKNLCPTFSTRDFIWEFMTAYEKDYVELFIEALPPKSEEKPKIIHNQHIQIGKYLQRNADKLGIEKLKDKKEPSLDPFGRNSKTQCWSKL